MNRAFTYIVATIVVICALPVTVSALVELIHAAVPLVLVVGFVVVLVRLANWLTAR